MRIYTDFKKKCSIGEGFFLKDRRLLAESAVRLNPDPLKMVVAGLKHAHVALGQGSVAEQAELAGEAFEA